MFLNLTLHWLNKEKIKDPEGNLKYESFGFWSLTENLYTEKLKL